MKRSEINKIIEEGIAFFRKHQFMLPPFAFWTPDIWSGKGKEYDEIRDNYLGWDITDFGSGDFLRKGLFLFTIRNGNLSMDKYKKTYAEKIMIVRENQITPLHFHWKKTEDIINRGGGNLLVKLYNSTEEENTADTRVTVNRGGRGCVFSSGVTASVYRGEFFTRYSGL